MKKLTRSADSYVEVSLGDRASNNVGGGADISTMAVVGEADFADEFDDKNSSKIQTSVCWNTRYPEWREYFHLTPVEDLDGSLYICVKDCSKIGSRHDEVIGYAEYSLTRLRDQQKHREWLSLHPPGLRKLSASKMDEDCAVRIEVRLFYSKQKLWEDRVAVLKKVLAALKGEGRMTNNTSSSSSSSSSHRSQYQIESRNAFSRSSKSPLYLSSTSSSANKRRTAQSSTLLSAQGEGGCKFIRQNLRVVGDPHQQL